MKVMKNFLYNMGYQVLIIIVPLLLAPYISRVVGPNGIGTYSYTYSIVSLFGLFVNLGIAKYGNREISKCEHDRRKRSVIFSELVSVKLGCAIIVFTLWFCFIKFSGGEYSTAFLIQTFNLLSFIFDVSWFFWGMQEFKVTTVICAVYNFMALFAVFAFVRSEKDVYIYILIMAVRAFLIQLTPWIFLRRYINISISLRYFVNNHWKSLILLFFPVIAKYLYSAMDRIMLGNMVGIEEVGYYENVQSMTITAVTVLMAAGDVIMPRMTVLFEQDAKKEAKDFFYVVFHLISFLAVGGMFGFIGVARDFIPWFYGTEFFPCVLLLQMIAPAVLFSGYADLIRNVFLLPRYMDREYVIALILGAVANFVINYTLIGRYGSAGAIIGTVSAEFIVMVVQIWFVRKNLDMIYFISRGIVYCLLGGGILYPCSLIHNMQLPAVGRIILEIVTGGGIYLLAVVIYFRFAEKKIYHKIKGYIFCKAKILK